MGVIALVVTLVAVLAAAGHGAYLAMLTSAARKRPGGEPVVEFARGRMPVAGVPLAVALVAMVLASAGGFGVDVFATLLGAGSGAYAANALKSTQHRFRSGEY